MRYLALVVTLVLALMPAETVAQGFTLHSLTGSSGKGVITSGLGGAVRLEKGEDTYLEFTADNSQIFGDLGHQFFDDRLTLAATGGLLMNTPWIGPKISVSLGRLTAMTWPGWSFGHYGSPELDINWGIKSGFLFVDLEPFTLTGVVLKFEENPVQYVTDITYAHRINSQLDVSGGTSYEWTEEEPLFLIAVKWFRTPREP